NPATPAAASQNPFEEAQSSPVAPPAEQRWLWFMLPACASTLLLAATNKICQDVAVIPFLWVLPLALYLLSFIIAFDSPRWYSRFWFGLLYFVSLVGVCYALYRGVNVPVWQQLLYYGGSLFFAAMVCHGELYRLRPPPARLTAYFLWVSAGGACGGLLVALLAPAILPDNYEFQAALIFPGITLFILFWRENRPVMDRRTFYRHAAILFSGVLVATMALVAEVLWNRRHAILSMRNFYGSMTVFEYNKDKPDGHYYLLQHGKITDGLQFRHITFSEWPTTYYCEDSGIGLTMSQLRKDGSKRVGLVGLGTGTLTSYGRKGDYFRIYEINPAVEKIARETFSYVGDSAAKVDIILGDARLSMESEPSQQFDILALDAFSSDAIPVHLLTREAFALYQRHLKPDGVIVVHVSNRYLDLRPVVTDLAADAGMKSAIVEYEEVEDRWWNYSSTWILVTRNQDLLDDAKIATSTDFEELTRKVPLWTDDYSALFQILK
ncbi:MAG TPA: fused MFS/spermidine synthase, partial [Roseimicrobium sp.]|nr:fused MFS/spermidine synthase [Roseimicrobium sp.]